MNINYNKSPIFTNDLENIKMKLDYRNFKKIGIFTNNPNDIRGLEFLYLYERFILKSKKLKEKDKILRNEFYAEIDGNKYLNYKYYELLFNAQKFNNKLKHIIEKEKNISDFYFKKWYYDFYIDENDDSLINLLNKIERSYNEKLFTDANEYDKLIKYDGIKKYQKDPKNSINPELKKYDKFSKKQFENELNKLNDEKLDLTNTAQKLKKTYNNVISIEQLNYLSYNYKNFYGRKDTKDKIDLYNLRYSEKSVIILNHIENNKKILKSYLSKFYGVIRNNVKLILIDSNLFNSNIPISSGILYKIPMCPNNDETIDLNKNYHSNYFFIENAYYINKINDLLNFKYYILSLGIQNNIHFFDNFYDLLKNLENNLKFYHINFQKEKNDIYIEPESKNNKYEYFSKHCFRTYLNVSNKIVEIDGEDIVMTCNKQLINVLTEKPYGDKSRTFFRNDNNFKIFDFNHYYEISTNDTNYFILKLILKHLKFKILEKKIDLNMLVYNIDISELSKFGSNLNIKYYEDFDSWTQHQDVDLELNNSIHLKEYLNLCINDINKKIYILNSKIFNDQNSIFSKLKNLNVNIDFIIKLIDDDDVITKFKRHINISKGLEIENIEISRITDVGYYENVDHGSIKIGLYKYNKQYKKIMKINDKNLILRELKNLEVKLDGEIYLKHSEDNNNFSINYDKSRLIDFILKNNISGKYILHIIYKINDTHSKVPNSSISSNNRIINNEIIKYIDDYYYLIGNNNEEIAPDLDKIVIKFNKFKWYDYATIINNIIANVSFDKSDNIKSFMKNYKIYYKNILNKLNEDVENDINSILFDNKLNDSEILLKLEEAKHITKENTSSNFSDYNTLNTMGILKSNNNKNLDNVVNLIKNSYIYDKLLLNKN